MENIIINPKKEASACVIWLHGLGADGNDFAQIVPELNLPEDKAVKFIFPHAPVRSVTINGGMQQRAWFDIASPDRGGLEADREGLEASAQMLKEMAEVEMAQGIPSDKILLAGFSQGGAVALFAGLTMGKPLAGIMGLSTYLPEWVNVDANQTPIFLAHGNYDPLLPHRLGSETKKKLEASDCNVSWFEYPMAHEVCFDEIQDIRQWLSSVL